MAVTVTTQWERVSYLLTISGVDGQLEVLRWTVGTGVVTAGAGVALPQTLLDMLERRIARLVGGIAANDREDQVQLLPSLLNVRDLGAVADVSVNVQDGYHALELGRLTSDRTFYVLLSFPHAVGAPLC